MSQEPFPGRGHDGEQRDSSRPLPAQGNGPEARSGDGPWPEDDWDAEAAIDSLVRAIDDGAAEPQLGWLEGSEPLEAGFGDGGTADGMGPGPVLAALVHAAPRDEKALAALSEDELVGVISAVRRIESRAAWAAMSAMRELAGRRRPGRDQVPAAADELALALTQSWQSVSAQIDYACQVAARLPRTFAALAAGRIHPVHVRIIEDETRYLSAENAAKADEELAQAAQSKSFGELRYAAHRLILKLDPGSAQRRKEQQAKREAHVRRFREDSGNAGMVARELPPDEVLASWQHVEQRALDLRTAGVPGTLRELRIRAYLDLLQERDSRHAVAAAEVGQAGCAPGSHPDHHPGGPHDGDGADGGPDGNGGPGRDPKPSPAGAGGNGGTGPAAPEAGPSVAALVTITVPLATTTGQSAAPGEVGGFGLLDAEDTVDLVAAAARHPRTRWCMTVVRPDGTAAAHGCIPGPHPVPPDVSRFTLNAVIRGPCDHSQAETHYKPSRKLQHLITARSARCTAPGCGRPAARCDLDHTNPWHQGGLTCPCNLAPLCRHHHKCKQSNDWTLEQPEPGVLIWRTPAGRTYTTTPTEYAV
jgi:hypothetical protein